MKWNEPNNNIYCNENVLDNSDYHYITKIKIEEKKNDDKDDDNRNKIKNKAKKHTNIDNYHFPNSLFWFLYYLLIKEIFS